MTFVDWFVAVSSVVVVLTGVAAAAAWGRQRYTATIGSRKALTRRLDSLAVGTTREFVDSLFGTALRRSVQTGGTKLTFDCGHALVAVMVDEADSVAAFGITVTDPKFAYSIDSLVLRGNGTELGRDRFSSLPEPMGGAEFSVGKRDAWYREKHVTSEADGQAMSYTVAAVPFGYPGTDGGPGGRRTNSHPPASRVEPFRDYMVRPWSTKSLSRPQLEERADVIQWARRTFVMNTLLFPADVEIVPDPGDRIKWRTSSKR